jgi:hypothetical protein
MSVDRTLSDPEDIGSFTADHLSYKLVALPSLADDLLDRHTILGERQYCGNCLFAAQIAFILQLFRTRQQRRIDRHGTDRGADRAHGFAHGAKGCLTCVCHEVPAIGDLPGVGQFLFEHPSGTAII